EAGLEKPFDAFQLCLIFVSSGNCCVCRGEIVRMDLAFPGSRIVRLDQRHMTVGTSHRLRRIVKGACTFAGYSTCLPVVVVVESTYPSITIDWYVEVNFVAGGAKLRRMHKGL